MPKTALAFQHFTGSVMDLDRRKKLGLSPREAETLELAADGLTDKEVAQKLKVGRATVRTFWDRIRRKLDASNRAQAIARAFASEYRPGVDKPPPGALSTLMSSEDLGLCIVEPGGVILEANDAFLHMIEYTREELDRGEIHWDNITLPEYEARDLLAKKELSRRGMITPYEKEYVTKTGARIRVRRGSALLGSVDRSVNYVIALSAPHGSPHAERVHRFASLLQ
jgi:PAS domain S-box-containing protein